MQFLRSNTAVIVSVGPFYDKTDGVTIETALTITNERITLTADTDAGSAPTNILDNVTGATSGTDNDLNYITANDAGMMQLELSAANTNRVGRMLLSITDAANHVPVFHEFFVLPQAIFDWLTGVIVPLPANVTQLLGTAWLAPGVAGTPDVNAKLLGATAQTGRDIGASVLLSPGTGTGQVDMTSGIVKANLAQILGTALTETAGQLAAAFKKFFDKAAPTGTINSIPDAVAGAGGQAEGNYVWLQHAPEDTGLPFWVYAKYQHLPEVPRHVVGEKVQVGQVVGLSGKTGTTGGHYGARGYPHLHLTTVAGRSDQYERQGSRIIPEAARMFDPVAIYVRGLNDLDEIDRLSDERKTVPIPYVAENGTIHPVGSLVVWPVRCKSR